MTKEEEIDIQKRLDAARKFFLQVSAFILTEDKMFHANYIKSEDLPQWKARYKEKKDALKKIIDAGLPSALALEMKNGNSAMAKVFEELGLEVDKNGSK